MSSEWKIKPTHPLRVWLSQAQLNAVKKAFQSTHPLRVWLNEYCFPDVEPVFQPTHPRRVWLLSYYQFSCNVKFQPTHPRRVWPCLSFSILSFWRISTHTPAKGVTLDRSHQQRSTKEISTHTPAKGVTVPFDRKHPTHQISTHTPAKGVTLAPIVLRTLKPQHFNPHTREGCDDLFYSHFWSVKNFNPHTREGCDRHRQILNILAGLFQPTHPRRVWLSQVSRQAECTNFNLHTREGCDFCLCAKMPDAFLFQPTHPRRVWRWRWNKFSYVVGISTHTPAKGVTTVKMMILMDTWLISTHTPAKGVTYWNLIMSCPFYFNPHTREGCDRHHSVH